MIVLDASVLIAFLENADTHHTAAEQLLIDAVGEDLAISTVTLAEILVAPARNACLDQALAALDGLEVQELLFPKGAAVQLAELRATTGLKMPDCCVIYAAENASVSIASFDERLVQVAKMRKLPVFP